MNRYLGFGAVGICIGIGILMVGTWFWDGQASKPGDASDKDQVAFGGRVYGRICANCHGNGMDGQLGWQQPMKDGTRLAPAHNDQGKTWRLDDKSLFEVVKSGGDFLKQDGTTSRMPAFKDKLTDDEIWAVIAFIKSSWSADIQEAQQEETTKDP